MRRMTESLRIALIVASFGFVAATSGCAYRGAKVVEGTDLAVGINVPASDGALQLQLLNYLSGFRLGVDRNAIMRVRYSVDENNSYLGLVHTKTEKTVDATVEPVDVNAQ